MRKPLEFLACVPLPWLLYRLTEYHRNFPDAVIVAGAVPVVYAVVCRIRRGRMDRLLKTVLIGVALCYAVGAIVVAEGLWAIWGSAWSAVMGVVFLASLALRRPVFLTVLPQGPGSSSGRPAAVLTAAWGAAFLFEGWWRLWSRADWPFEHFLAAVPAVSYLVVAALVAWSFWYTARIARRPAN
ncbi:hypothetical protein [Bordetella bronchialis]|uniref:hypothetical protein n=1 Tax=Bordetella bronchialis TaxID=463025 RepID=UPI000A4C51AD|nr:hypothetical protein [Bordetella bronchialis]